jgi:F0F1-type ATP synthase membrane subunit c/vacuolar-type H+-ATPase subunit K
MADEDDRPKAERAPHPLMRFDHPAALAVRIMEGVLGIVALGLAAYTISVETGWRGAAYLMGIVKTPSAIKQKFNSRVLGLSSLSYGWR